MSRKRLIAIGLAGALAAELRRAVEGVSEVQLIEGQLGEVRGLGIKQRRTVPLPPVAMAYPSDRKSKGEKKRAASARRRKGWG